MTNKYRIETVSDFLNLDEDQFERIAADFCTFYFMYKEIVKNQPKAEGKITHFIWHDDGKNDFLGVVSDEKAGGGAIMRQLNINPEMDKLARDNGLGHWSCVSPLTKHLWIRSDGVEAVYDGINELTAYIQCKPIKITIVDGYSVFDALLCVDSEYPIGADWQQQTEIVTQGKHQTLENAIETGIVEPLKSDHGIFAHVYVTSGKVPIAYHVRLAPIESENYRHGLALATECTTRQEARQFAANVDMYCIEWLEDTGFDMESWINCTEKQSTIDLTEKTIVSNGCGECPFQNDGYFCNLNPDMKIEDDCFRKTRHDECPLLTHSIKVVKS